MSLKTKLLGVSTSLTGTIGTALAERNYSSYTPDTANGNRILSELPYVDKIMDFIDVIYALVPWVAIAVLGYLAISYYAGGWDSVENEIRTRKKFFAILVIILGLKVGTSLVALISNW
jgi:hypothetical protein